MAATLPHTIRSFVCRHWPLIVLVVAGVVLRVLAWFAYQPALMFGDSIRYLDNVGVFDPGGLHPIGYELFVLTPTLAVGGLELVTALQHVAGVVSAVALYALALRHGVNRWLAALAAAPLLLDAYQIQIEQLVMSDSWQQVLLVALLWVLVGVGAPSPRRAALAGVLLGMAVMLRLVAISLVVPVSCYLVIAGGAWRTWSGWRTMASRTFACAAAMGIVIAGYGWYFHAQTGEWGLSRTTANVLYGRAAVIADCETLQLDRLTALACPEEPLGQRRRLDLYAHIHSEADWRARFPPGTDLLAVQREFGREVIAQQPLDFAGAVALDFLKGFRPTRTDSPADNSGARWQFKNEYPTGDLANSIAVSREFNGRDPNVVPSLAAFLRGYQLSVGYTSGALLGMFGLIALLAGFGLGRARSSGIRSATLLAVGMAVTILLASAAFEFSWRYQLPSLVLLPFAGVLGITALWKRGPNAGHGSTRGRPAKPPATTTAGANPLSGKRRPKWSHGSISA
ncbi:MAG: hypothetical protein ACSLE6_00745 [Mycobacterium sp.]